MRKCIEDKSEELRKAALFLFKIKTPNFNHEVFQETTVDLCCYYYRL